MKIPRNYQIEAVDWMRGHNTYLCDDCGLGKTLTSIETVKAMALQDKKILVVCPKSGRQQWQETIAEQVPDVPDIIQTNHYKYKFGEINAWFITTYDELAPQDLLYYIARVVWDVMIIDEAHRLKNKNTKRSKNIPKLVAGRRIALSATPIEKHGGELWPILKWIAPEEFPAYWTWVNSMFEVKPGYFGGMDIGAPLDEVAYQAAVSPHIIRRTKQDVLPQLPPLIKTHVHVPMTGAQAILYQQVKESKDALVQIEDRTLLIQNALSLFVRLHQIASLPSMLGGQATPAKIEWLEDFLNDNPEKRVLVFSRYREVVDYVWRRFSKKGVFRVMGKGLDESDSFKKGYGQILVGTIDAMSESLSLEMADAVIFLDQHWSATQMKQAVDRIHRMNITDSKLAYYLESCPEDRKVMNVVDGKYDMQEMLLDFVNEPNT